MQLNGECGYSAAFGIVGKADCVTGSFTDRQGKASAWKNTPHGLMPDINLTNPSANWKDIFDCSNVTQKGREKGEGPNPNTTYPDPISWNINVTADNAICYDSTFS